MASIHEPFWITSVDNPYNFFEEFDEWYLWDCKHSGTRPDICSWIARVATSKGLVTEGKGKMDPSFQKTLINASIEEILKFCNPNEIVKITKDSYKKDKTGKWTLAPYTGGMPE